MKTILAGLVLLNVLAIGGVAQVHAKDGDLMTQGEFAARAQKAEALAERVRRVHTYDDKMNKLANKGNWERQGPSVNIPELDPNAAGAALALLVGGAFVLVDRRKRVAV